MIVFVLHLHLVVFEQLSNSIQLRVALLKNAGQKIQILRITDAEEFQKNVDIYTKTIDWRIFTVPTPVSCLLTPIELPHYGELKILAVVPWVEQAKQCGSSLGLQLEGG